MQAVKPEQDTGEIDQDEEVVDVLIVKLRHGRLSPTASECAPHDTVACRASGQSKDADASVTVPIAARRLTAVVATLNQMLQQLLHQRFIIYDSQAQGSVLDLQEGDAFVIHHVRILSSDAIASKRT